MYRISKKTEVTSLGRRSGSSPRIPYGESRRMPVRKMCIGDSFIAFPYYDYGVALSIKNIVRKEANKLGKNNWRFAVREHKGKIRVWRVK